jgi:hypothetical protein
MIDSVESSGLSEVFVLPPEIVDHNGDLVGIYEELVGNLRAEAFGIPMTSMQVLLIERIATKNVLIKHRERVGWLGTNAEKDANSQWLDLVKEWNRLLAQGHEAMRERLLEQVEKITADGVKLIEDTETRQKVRNFYQEQFAAMGY